MLERVGSGGRTAGRKDPSAGGDMILDLRSYACHNVQKSRLYETCRCLNRAAAGTCLTSGAGGSPALRMRGSDRIRACRQNITGL